MRIYNFSVPKNNKFVCLILNKVASLYIIKEISIHLKEKKDYSIVVL